MNVLKKIFITLLIVVFTTTSLFANPNCNNPAYRRAYPERCNYVEQKNNSDILLALVGGATLIGVGVALGMQSSGNSSSSSTVSNQNNFPRLTLSSNVYINYNQNDIINNQDTEHYYIGNTTNGSDIEDSVIQEIRNSAKYQRNRKQYDAINFAWAKARGFSGKDVKIDIIDDFHSYHGSTVNDLVKNIAKDATITTYNIASNANELYSYDSIANTINTAAPARIYNNSWQIESSSNINAATAIYNNNSPKTYAQAQQYMYNITSENFITQIRNTAVDNDAIFVWAAGNESNNESGALSALPIAFPELQGHFVNVVAYDTNRDEIAWYSNQCGITQNYCIAAPGSGWNTDSHDFASGTSFAAPVVSGAVATIQEEFPYMSAKEITDLLFATAQDLGTPGIDTVYGWGLLDIEKATQPVGTPKILLANNNSQTMSVSNMTGIAANALKKANLKIAFVDDFGRAFSTNLSDNINVVPYGRGFERLQEPESDSVVLFDKFEFGVKQNRILQSSGFASKTQNDLTNFIGYINEFNFKDIIFYQNLRLGMTNPDTDENSIIYDFSNIYTTNIKFGTKWQDLSFEFAIPETILYGNMFTNTPIRRADSGEMIYTDKKINLASATSTEYTIKYKNLSMTYINNPYYQDEFFIMAKGRFTF